MSGKVALNLSLKGEKEAEKHRLEVGRAGRQSVDLGGRQAKHPAQSDRPMQLQVSHGLWVL